MKNSAGSKLGTRIAAACLGLLALIGAAIPAAAHPSDEANVYHYLWFEARPGKIELQHATIAGGLISQAVWSQMDPNDDKDLSPEEQRRYAQDLVANLSLKINGKTVRWKLEEWEFPSHTEFFSGSFPAVKLRLSAPLPGITAAGPGLQVEDRTYPQFTGVFPEPVVNTGGVSLSDLAVGDNGRRTELRFGPAGARSVKTARSLDGAGKPDLSLETKPETSADRLPGLELEPRSTEKLPGLELEPRGSTPDPGASSASPDPSGDLRTAPLFKERGQILWAKPAAEKEDDHADALKGFLGQKLSLGVLLLALGAALLAGAAHALTPGHGKAMVAAYLVGSRGTVKDAILLGIVVTITHTSSVYLLGALCLWLTTRIKAEVVGAWLSVVSGALLLGMGFWLFQRGLLAYHGIKPLPGHSHGPGGHSHDHSHGDGHSHDSRAEEPRSRGAEGTGTAHAHEHSPSHAMAHAHSHTHASASPTPSHDAGHSHTHAGAASTDSAHSHTHTPEQTNTQHPTPGDSRRPPSDSPLDDYRGEATVGNAEPAPGRWGIISLGIAGGMVPCFDALAILIAAVNLKSLPLGLLIIAAFSLGMALVLVAIGVLMVTAKDLMRRFTGEAPWVRALPAVSGGILFLLGSWLTFRALIDVGVLRVG